MKTYGFDQHGCHDPLKDAPFWAIELFVVQTLILDQTEKIMAAIDDLVATVNAEDSVIDSAVILINGFAAQLAAAGVDPTKLANLQADIKAKTAALAAAIANNATPPPASATPDANLTAANAAVAQHTP